MSIGHGCRHIYTKPATFPPACDSLSLRSQRVSPSQRSELFTKQLFLISHSPTSMADRWHLVQYFIKSSWKLTVQSIRKVQSLSNINYLAGYGRGTPHSPFAVETFIAVDSRHILDSANLHKPPSDSKHWNLNNNNNFFTFIGQDYLGLEWAVFVLPQLSRNSM